MSKRVTMDIDGASVVMVTSASKERVDHVVKQVNEMITLVKSKDRSLSSNMAYRYAMVYLSDQVVELKEVLDSPGDGSFTDDKSMDLKREIAKLKEEILQWEGRTAQLQELLLEKNQQIQELKSLR
ncbi:MAG: cell division protein ZapA [Tissierellia bacterium]|jgi:hypothetical protein|nr:cell division protein ZapA [Tissierellia bacterium]